MTDKSRYIFECIQSKAHNLNLYTKSSTFSKVMMFSFQGQIHWNEREGEQITLGTKLSTSKLINSGSVREIIKGGYTSKPILASFRASPKENKKKTPLRKPGRIDRHVENYSLGYQP